MADEPAEQPAPAWRWPDALRVVAFCWIVLLFGGAIVISMGGWDAKNLPITAQFLAVLPFWAAAVGGSFWMASRSGDRPRAALGLALRPLDVPLGIAVGVGLQLLLPYVYVPLLHLTNTTSSDLDKPARELANSGPGTVGRVLFVVMACVAAPVAEELLYRGLLQRAAGWPTASLGLVVTAAIFAASHLQALQLPGLILFGLAAGFVSMRAGRLGPSIVAHIAFNTTAVILVLR